jgi:hypothetical protein
MTTITSANTRNNSEASRMISEDTRQGLSSKSAESSPRWRRGSGLSVDCTTETTSTATTITDRSQDPQDPSLETMLIRTRTNFGDNLYYVPPETKASPYSVPSGAPVTPKRDQLVAPNRLPPERRSPPKPPLSTQEEKRLQLFADEEPVDQIPFDQVWNQQEFTLADDEKKQKDLDTTLETQSVKSESSLPFDEAPENLEVSGSSAFSAFSASASSPISQPLQGRMVNATSLLKVDPIGPGGNALHPNISTGPPVEHFMMPQPRISEPTTMIGIRRPVSPPGGVFEARRAPSPPEMRDNVYTTDPDEGELPSDEENPSNCQSEGNGNSPSWSLHKALKSKGSEDQGNQANKTSKGQESDDKSVNSIFEFQGQKRSQRAPQSFDFAGDPSSRKSSASPRPKTPTNKEATKNRWRSRASVEVSSEDETSLDTDELEAADRGLKSRAQEAFASRRRFKSVSPRPSSPKSKSPSPNPTSASSPQTSPSLNPTPSPPPADPVVMPTKHKAQVSFGPTDTIHHFEKDYVYSDQDSAASSGTYENSTTVSNEVEEAIRDIFMINALGNCNPAPRKIRYYSDTKHEQRESEQNTTPDDEDDTAVQSDEEGIPAPRKKSLSHKKKSKRDELKWSHTDDIFFDTMLSMVEGGIGAFGAVLGLTPETEAEPGPIAPAACGPSRRAIGGHSRNGRSGSAIDGVIDSVSDYILDHDEKSEFSEVSRMPKK